MSDRTTATAAYSIAGSETLKNFIAKRGIDNSVPYILPYLNSLPPNFVFLDVGCGPGTITIDVARRFPQATILAIDGGEASLQSAKENAAAVGVKNIQFALGDALDLQSLSFPEVQGGCDFVHAHQVAQHVRDAKQMLKCMRAASKPLTGVVALREAEHGAMTAYPETEAMKMGTELYQKMAIAKGSDPLVGRKLVQHALSVGYKREEVEASVDCNWIFSTPDERQEFMIIMQAATEAFEAAGIDASKIKQGWKQWNETEYAWLAFPCSRVVCRRGDQVVPASFQKNEQ